VSRRRRLLVGWTLALLAIAGFASLGRWQLQRAVEKQAMLDTAAAVLDRRERHALSTASDPARARDYDWAEGRGHFDARGPLWLDNQQRDGRPGVRAYRIFLPEGGAPLLVDLGWLPLPLDRRLPTVAMPVGEMELRGLLAPPPSAGLAIGPALAAQDGGWLLTRVDTAAITGEAGLSAPLAPRVLRLDPALPLGYERDLTLLANTLPPEKHRGYAEQWLAMAAAVLATALILTFRKARHDHAS
jgi:cytochrome oxidase assembly protein ShyY1